MSVSIGVSNELSLNPSSGNARVLLDLLGFKDLGMMNPRGVPLALFVERIALARAKLASGDVDEFTREATVGKVDISQQPQPMKYAGGGGLTVGMLTAYIDRLDAICASPEAQEKGKIGWM